MRIYVRYWIDYDGFGIEYVGGDEVEARNCGDISTDKDETVVLEVWENGIKIQEEIL